MKNGYNVSLTNVLIKTFQIYIPYSEIYCLCGVDVASCMFAYFCKPSLNDS